LQSYERPYRNVTTSAYSSRIVNVFAGPFSAPAPGISWSRSSDLLPVQSIRTSPGSAGSKTDWTLSSSMRSVQ
jgi:hypothetical protein